jgi:hypothetical protein
MVGGGCFGGTRFSIKSLHLGSGCYQLG